MELIKYVQSFLSSKGGDPYDLAERGMLVNKTDEIYRVPLYVYVPVYMYVHYS